MTKEERKATLINKTITARQALENTKRTLYVNDKVLDSAPKNKGDNKVEFFKLNHSVTTQELQDEYDKRGLIPADIWEMSVLEDSYDKYATQWKNKEGIWCCAFVGRWSVERRVDVRRDVDWDDSCWFGGVRKSDLKDKKLKTLEPKSSDLPKTLLINGVEYIRK